MPHDGCANRSATLGESLGGTAPVANAWLLIETPGPWGPSGLLESDVEEDVAALLTERAAAAGVRIQLIRRRDRTPGSSRRVFLASSRPDATWLVGLTCDAEYADLSRLDLGALVAGPAPPIPADWEAVDEPLFLVCTHAKRDPCCAVYGRAAAAVLGVTQRERTWETSHTGGHRFAPNLICLPHGLAFGRLDPEATAAAAAAYADGDIVPAGYRGRSSHDRFAQAAEVAVREQLGRAAVDAVRVRSVDGAGSARTVHLDTRDGTARVEVVQRPTGTPRLIGCHKDEPSDPGEHVATELAIEVRA